MSLASLPIGLARPAFAAAGDLDTSFSGDGKLTTDFGSKQDFALGLALQADGKIVAAGVSAANGTNPKFALTRYNDDGTLDTTFSGDGKVTTDFQSGNLDAANGVVAQSDGEIVAAGLVYTSQTDAKFALIRYNSDGTLDTTFSGDGNVNADLSSKEDYGLDVAMTSEGRVVAAGIASADGSNPTFGLARFATDGTLDTTFDGDGKVTTDFTSAVDYASGVAIQGDDKI